MGRIILGAIVGFIAWSVIWVGSERIMSAIWPEWYGVHQVAFEAAVKDGGDFTPDTTILVMNIVRGALLSIFCGFLAAWIARENKRSPLILGVMLLLFDLMIVWMSKGLVPVWYLAIFTILILPMTMVGGRLKKSA